MKIIDLRQAPEHIPTIARWHFDEWGYQNPEKDFAYRLERMQRYLGDKAMPRMLIAVNGEAVLGTASLVESDMDDHLELSPWLANVYINEDQRGLGIGKKLVQALMDFAGQQHLTHFYLFTQDQAGFYANLGWRTVSQETYHGTPVTIMRFDF